MYIGQHIKRVICVCVLSSLFLYYLFFVVGKIDVQPNNTIRVKGLIQDFEGSRPRLMCIRVVEIISFPSPCMLCKNSQPREVASIIFLLLQELVFPFSTTFQHIFHEVIFLSQPTNSKYIFNHLWITKERNFFLCALDCDIEIVY